MKKVLVFFNSQQVEVINVLKPVTSIIRNYPNGDEVSLKVMLTEIHSLTGAPYAQSPCRNTGAFYRHQREQNYLSGGLCQRI